MAIASTYRYRRQTPFLGLKNKNYFVIQWFNNILQSIVWVHCTLITQFDMAYSLPLKGNL
jgi:hypothetical protein